MDSTGRYYTEETLRSEVIEPELRRENRAERRKREAIARQISSHPTRPSTDTRTGDNDGV